MWASTQNDKTQMYPEIQADSYESGKKADCSNFVKIIDDVKDPIVFIVSLTDCSSTKK